MYHVLDISRLFLDIDFNHAILESYGPCEPFLITPLMLQAVIMEMQKNQVCRLFISGIIFCFSKLNHPVICINKH